MPSLLLMTPTRTFVLAALTFVPVTIAHAQFRVEPTSSRWWLGGAALSVAALTVDEPLRSFANDHRSPALDDIANGVGALGRARYLVPGLTLFWAVPRLTGHRRLADAALRITLGYAAADGMASILKPLIGRHRPDSSGRPFRFDPIKSGDKWHSLPSGHTTHAFAMAAGLAEEARNPWVSLAVFGAASAVGAQRIYTQSHWTSDVVASATLATGVSLTTVRWLRRRSSAPAEAPPPRTLHDWTLVAGSDRLGLRVRL